MRRPSEALKKRIHDGLARLPGELAASRNFGVSRNAYREAVRILAAKGLVESRQKAGTLVTERDRWNLLDPQVISWMLSDRTETNFRDLLFELRAIVEPAAAALAAQRRSPDDLKAMNEALEVMRAHAPDSVEGELADERFHAAILAAGRNEIVARLASIIAASVAFVAEFKRERQISRDPWPDHMELFESIKRQEPDEAHAAMHRHIAHARDDLREVQAERTT